MPIRNPNDYLQNILEIIKELENTDIKIILVHDLQPGDDERKISQLRCAGQKSNVEFISGEYGSPGLARNAGLHIVKSTWVAFWDCDDNPDIPQIAQINTLPKYWNSDLIVTGFTERIIRNGEIIQITNLVRESHFHDDLVAKPGLWRLYFNVSSVGDLRFTELLMAEDQLFISDFLATEKRIIYCDKSTYTYNRVGQNQLTSSLDALQDLLPAFQASLSRISLNGSGNQNIRIMFAAKQFLSGIKYLNGKNRVKILTALLFAWRKVGFRRTVILYSSILTQLYVGIVA
jgi:glycosyltransferase involved in cell wall biosynthesis